jgi:hypothetical protein
MQYFLFFYSNNGYVNVFRVTLYVHSLSCLESRSLIKIYILTEKVESFSVSWRISDDRANSYLLSFNLKSYHQLKL